MKLAEIAFFTDQAAAIMYFYRRLFGVDPAARSETMAIFFVHETKIFIHYRYFPKYGELPLENHYAFVVEEVDRVREQLIEQGLRLEIPPQEFYEGGSAHLRDPDGHQIEIIQTEKSHAG